MDTAPGSVFAIEAGREVHTHYTHYTHCSADTAAGTPGVRIDLHTDSIPTTEADCTGAGHTVAEQVGQEAARMHGAADTGTPTTRDTDMSSCQTADMAKADTGWYVAEKDAAAVRSRTRPAAETRR